MWLRVAIDELIWRPRLIGVGCFSGASNDDKGRAGEMLAQRVVPEHGCQRLGRQ